ncbi:serine/threonine-protein kinase gin4-related [Anaeramoeba flamelloides]|uniref:Serine/threonine-protein kinase gin4-related n=1 Tax=Anaeramoeba flamelloides TaxID=1746091 RepID=A0ABQ8Z0I2_9EUKA|nr:serine/threonine-protein kinase gin4-related [Anaeramoeba flamelloides]
MSFLYIGPYKVGKTLGVGSSSKVKLAVHKETKKKVAIKILSKSFLSEKPQRRKKIEREISILKLLKHPNLMRLYDVYETSKYLYLIMEYVSGGELFDLLVSKGSLSHQKTLRIFQQIIYGLSYLHERLICHRDLKPENLLLDSNHCIKIVDFGMAQIMKNNSLLKTSCGSPHYASPEVISGLEYDGKKADVWCCGIILFALLSGRLPFDSKNIKRLLLKIKKGEYRMSSKFTNLEKNLIKKMLIVDPKKRISIDEIKKHPWFTSNYPTNYIPQNSSINIMKIGTLKKEILIPKILQILKTLGWGNKEELTNALCSEEINQEKIFYVMSYKSMGLKTSKPNYQKKRSISLQETNPELKPKISTSETVLTLSKNEKETKEQEYNLDNIILSSNNYTKTNENESESENQPSNDEEFLISSPDLEKSPNSTRKGAISMKNSLENEENENNIYQMGTPRFHRTKDDDIGSLPITQSPKTRWFGSLFHKKQMENLDLNNNIQNTINLDINLTNQENETEKTEKKNEEEIKPQLFSLEYQISLFETITRFQTSLMAMNFQWQFPSIKLIKVKYQKMKMKILFQQSKNDKKTKVIIKYTKGDPKTFNLLTKNLIQKTSN